MAELLFDRIFSNLFTHKLYHFFGGALVILALTTLEKNWFILFAVLFFFGYLFWGKRISFAIIGILLLYVISGSKNLTAFTAIIWLVGDGMAGLVGGTFGKQKLSWHEQKTILGSFAFFLSSWIVGLALIIPAWEAPPNKLLVLTTIACLVASLVESLPVSFIHDRKPDDNLAVLLVTGLTVWSCSELLGLGSLV